MLGKETRQRNCVNFINPPTTFLSLFPLSLTDIIFFFNFFAVVDLSLNLSYEQQSQLCSHDIVVLAGRRVHWTKHDEWIKYIQEFVLFYIFEQSDRIARSKREKNITTRE